MVVVSFSIFDLNNYNDFPLLALDYYGYYFVSESNLRQLDDRSFTTNSGKKVFPIFMWVQSNWWNEVHVSDNVDELGSFNHSLNSSFIQCISHSSMVSMHFTWHIQGVIVTKKLAIVFIKSRWRIIVLQMGVVGGRLIGDSLN